ncbi:MAG TPA: nucleotidyl transferase AbiEii/AbiGii toxin family protein [Rhizomicrobium sp.]|nr:nucleotidyl transferase AbiEii/AbiGii toxin family protein [Rhizomicrobium sp.]
MTESFSPRLEILPPPQRRLWDELSQIPPGFVLYGGTAIALHLGHRESADFDFFSDRRLDEMRLAPSVPLLANAVITQRAPDTLSCIVDREGPVKLSFFGLPALGRLRTPVTSPDNGLRIASLPDLAATKMAVVQMRAEARDYIDIDALIERARIDLATALAGATAIYGAQFNAQLTLKALSYFGDGNLRQLSRAVRDRLVQAVKAVDLDRLPLIRTSPG